MVPTRSSRFRPQSPTFSPRQRLVRTADLREGALIGLYALTAAALPQDRWQGVADIMHRVRRGISRRWLAPTLERMRAVRGVGMTAEAVYAWDRAYQKHADRRRLYTVAARFTRRWQPDIALSGADHLDAALAKGNGALLWMDVFVHSSVIAKRALYQAGYGLHYLSSFLHPTSGSAAAQRLVNPVYVADELAHLSERIVLTENNQVACTRRMLAILRGNGIVGVTNTISSRMRFIAASFGPTARLVMSTTVPGLALQTGAPILPVVAIETEPLRKYSVTIGPPLYPDASLDRDRAAEELAAAYARWLLPLVKEHSDQWGGWKGTRIQLPQS